MEQYTDNGTIWNISLVGKDGTLWISWTIIFGVEQESGFTNDVAAEV